MSVRGSNIRSARISGLLLAQGHLSSLAIALRFELSGSSGSYASGQQPLSFAMQRNAPGTVSTDIKSSTFTPMSCEINGDGQ